MPDLRWLPDPMYGLDKPLPVLRDAGHVDGLDAVPTLHSVRSAVCADGRTWTKCSCGLVVERFDAQETCPMEEAEADLQEAVRLAIAAYTRDYARYQLRSERAEAELAHALEVERR